MYCLLLDTALCGTYTLYRAKNQFKYQDCLFRDTRDEGLEDYAPWLFEVKEENFAGPFSDDPLVNLKSFILLKSNKPCSSLMKHLQKFLYRVIDGKEYFFRFYDPRVLKKFCQNAEGEVMLEFFKPLQFLVAGCFENDTAFRYSPVHNRIREDLIDTALFFGRDKKVSPENKMQLKNKRPGVDKSNGWTYSA